MKVDTSAFDSIIGNIKKRQFRDQISEQEQDWNEYIIKYGTFQQKKEAIARKYNKAIEESATAGEAASLFLFHVLCFTPLKNLKKHYLI